jgi:ABC-2 type transport system permease protein
MDAKTSPLARPGLRTLVRYRLMTIRNQILHVRRESMLKIVVVTILGVAFWSGLLFLFLHGFQFVNDNALLGAREYLIRNVLSLFFLTLIFMLVFSNAVISLQNLFKAPETAFLFALPLRHDTIFLYKFLESLVFSSWAVFAAGLPLLLAYGIKSDVDWYFYPISIIFMVPFVVLPAAAGALLGLVLMAVLPRHGYKLLGLLVIVVLALAIYIVVTIFSVQNRFGSGYGSELQANVQAVLGRLSFTQNIMTPNYWITEGLLSISDGRRNGFQAGGLFFCALVSSALFALSLSWFIAGSIYELTYSAVSAASSIRRIVRQSMIEELLLPLTERFPKVMILLIKDIKTFLRDPAQWSQVLIFFGILTLYIGNLRNFSYPLDQPFYQNLIASLNLGATSMTLATMTSRFIFPLISLEGRRFWILGLLPIERRQIMISKFLFAASGSLLLMVGLIFLSNYILRGTSLMLTIQLATGSMIAVGLSGLSVGMGAIFPSFEERNPSKIVSGFGGTLTLIIAIGLVIVSIIAEGVVCHHYFGVYADRIEDDTPWGIYEALAGIGVLNIIAAYVPMRVGIRALERVEF